MEPTPSMMKKISAGVLALTLGLLVWNYGQPQKQKNDTEAFKGLVTQNLIQEVSNKNLENKNFSYTAKKGSESTPKRTLTPPKSTPLLLVNPKLDGEKNIQAPTPIANPVCGNGLVESGEQCDDGNTSTEACLYGEQNCQVCSATCQWENGETSYCGDGMVDSMEGESCDGGPNCQNSCLFSQIEIVQASLTSYANTLKNKIIPEGSEEYLPPSASQINSFKAGLQALIEGNEEQAWTLFQPLDYTVRKLVTPNQKNYWVVEEKLLDEDGQHNEKGWGTLIFNENASQPHINLQVPHAISDSNTLDLALVLFQELDAGALTINGAHRRANSVFGLNGYEISDAVHNQGTFYAMTQILANDNQDVTLETHGFNYENHADFLNQNPVVETVISKGNTSNTNPTQLAIANKLTVKGFGVATCGKNGWNQLCATQNTGKDYINSNPSRGVFIHMEWSNTIRSNGAGNFNNIAQAVKEALL